MQETCFSNCDKNDFNITIDSISLEMLSQKFTSFYQTPESIICRDVVQIIGILKSYPRQRHRAMLFYRVIHICFHTIWINLFRIRNHKINILQENFRVCHKDSNRTKGGVLSTYVVCVDGLKGFPEAINAVFQ